MYSLKILEHRLGQWSAQAQTQPAPASRAFWGNLSHPDLVMPLALAMGSRWLHWHMWVSCFSRQVSRKFDWRGAGDEGEGGQQQGTLEEVTH